jgi:hypothetical protein
MPITAARLIDAADLAIAHGGQSRLWSRVENEVDAACFPTTSKHPGGPKPAGV